ncbi:hypothetical protein N7486_005535 [Penicillium sp. IBT 16267x]|nr:hypothetical protein N7486_005535 [Penicillium sp. IBT 16267x]
MSSSDEISSSSSSSSSSDDYDFDQCKAAIEGKQVPKTLESVWHHRATIRGIRLSLEFATSAAVTDLCSGNEDRASEFSRARNARLIMSNMMPDLQNPSHQPYCIWYPDFAEEDTYREIARQYPSMRYQVGRACAAAGYTNLYKELDLLPDISIAEEARESGQGSEIYQSIMSAAQRYAVMNDFTRSIDMDTPRTPAFLNGDMKPRWSLDQRFPPPKDLPNTSADDIDIEEDGFIGIEEIEIDQARYHLGPEQAKLLWTPLPLDIPIFEKGVLTQMAAYEGNVDRYVRLMHPRRLRTDDEFYSTLRGIYHNTMFARWWADQIETNPQRIIRPGSTPDDNNKRDCDLIRTAINARRIMINDISGLTDDPNHRPWMIWWPLKPHHNTLMELAIKCPSMKPQIAITCILSDDQALYEQLNPRPRPNLLQMAYRSENPFYLEDLKKREAEQGMEFEYLGPMEGIGASLELDLEPTTDVVFDRIYPGAMNDDYGYEGVYGSIQAWPGMVERYVWLSTETVRLIEEECDGVYQGSDTDLLYIEPDNESKCSK